MIINMPQSDSRDVVNDNAVTRPEGISIAITAILPSMDTLIKLRHFSDAYFVLFRKERIVRQDRIL